MPGTHPRRLHKVGTVCLGWHHPATTCSTGSSSAHLSIAPVLSLSLSIFLSLFMRFAAVLYYVLAIRRCFLLARVSCKMTGIENENGDHVDGSVLNNVGGSCCCWESEDMTISSAAPPGRAGGGRKPVALTELAKLMADFAVDREWDQFHSPRNLLLALVGEVGELSEIFQWKGEVPRGLADWNEAEKEHLGEELSDVLLYLVRLADVCDVDLGQAALHKLQKNAVKYPVDVCKGSFKKFNGVSAVGHNVQHLADVPHVFESLLEACREIVCEDAVSRLGWFPNPSTPNDNVCLISDLHF